MNTVIKHLQSSSNDEWGRCPKIWNELKKC